MSDSRPTLDATKLMLPAAGVVTVALGVVAWVGQGMVSRLDALQGSVHRLELRLTAQEATVQQLADHELRLRALEGRVR